LALPRIAIAGSSGFIGSALVPVLRTAGYEVLRLVRPTSESRDWPDSLPWNPDQGELDSSRLEGFEAIINLAGENIAKGRWFPAKKQHILESRTKATSLLANTLADLREKPRFFFSASAVGYYEPSGDKVLTEADPPGSGFLSQVCVAWEAATRPAWDAGIRTVHGRIGVVLSKEGGALAAMLPFFRWGLGGRLGLGTQYVPWIMLSDLLAAILHCMKHTDHWGAVNLTAPEPVTNLELTKTLAAVLGKPSFLPAPERMLRLALGREKAESLLLASLRVVPLRLQEIGFAFTRPDLKVALHEELL
jgi:uncharacterized protein (TIGR01777 family)